MVLFLIDFLCTVVREYNELLFEFFCSFSLATLDNNSISFLFKSFNLQKMIFNVLRKIKKLIDVSILSYFLLLIKIFNIYTFNNK